MEVSSPYLLLWEYQKQGSGASFVPITMIKNAYIQYHTGENALP